MAKLGQFKNSCSLPDIRRDTFPYSEELGFCKRLDQSGQRQLNIPMHEFFIDETGSREPGMRNQLHDFLVLQGGESPTKTNHPRHGRFASPDRTLQKYGSCCEIEAKIKNRLP